ncbi:integrase, catalytic region, zinc finger, CCHC-type containing protein [Tanacetum coccineum]
MTRQNANIKETKFDNLFDTLSQYEPHVIASKANKAIRNHDPLALVAHSNIYSSHSHASPSYSHSSQPYYVTHPSSVIDYEEDYEGEIQRDAHEDNLKTAMIPIINVGYTRNGNKNARRSNRNQIATAGNGMVKQIETNDQIIQRVPQTESNPRKSNVQCYNCNAKGYYAHDCPQPKVRDAKYFREQMLLAMKDEARGNLNEAENDFMLDN